MNTNNSVIQELVNQARRQGMIITQPGLTYYDCDRLVHNERLEKCPCVIAHCRNREDVSFWLKGFRKLKGHKVPLSIRSGGHHHEAMCVNDGGVVLSLDQINKVELDENLQHAWVGSGQRLEQVVNTLAYHDRLLPTGGCGTVCVGGLTQGGGWGMSYRYLGLTADKLREVEMVLPNGDIVSLDKDGWTQGTKSPEVNPVDLFWAIRGGGGGNFGVITRFRFELEQPPQCYTSFTLHWGKSARADVARSWVALCQRTDNPKLNTFARMTAVDSDKHDEKNPSFIVGGRFYGTKEECINALSSLTHPHEPELCQYTPHDFSDPDGHRIALMLDAGPAPCGCDGKPLPAQSYALQPGARSKESPSQTCILMPEPHKVSSVIPKADCLDDIVQVAAKLMDSEAEIPGVNMYLSWHGMGGHGTIAPDGGTAYPWRDSPYMLQIQAWWLEENDVDETQVLNWVSKVREGLQDYSRGAFINFADRDLPTEWYYGSSWDRLKKIKAQVDPENLLKFEMGIPPA